MRLAVKRTRGPWAEQRGAAAAGANLAARSAAGWPRKHSLPLAAATASATSANCTPTAAGWTRCRRRWSR